MTGMAGMFPLFRRQKLEEAQTHSGKGKHSRHSTILEFWYRVAVLCRSGRQGRPIT